MTKARYQANAVVAFHTLWVSFGLISLPLLFIIPHWGRVVLVFAALTLLGSILFGACVLTKLENHYRRLEKPSTAYEDEGFVQHYLRVAFKIKAKRRTLQIINNGVALLLLILGIAKF